MLGCHNPKPKIFRNTKVVLFWYQLQLESYRSYFIINKLPKSNIVFNLFSCIFPYRDCTLVKSPCKENTTCQAILWPFSIGSRGLISYWLSETSSTADSQCMSDPPRCENLFGVSCELQNPPFFSPNTFNELIQTYLLCRVEVNEKEFS